MDNALQIDLMERRLFRSHAYLTRLEKQKALSGRMLKRLNNELQQAKDKIEKQNRILQESLTLAQEVQQSLIPNQAPSVDYFDIAGSSLYCDETGGDHLDYLKLEDGIAVVVGDVSGHGIAAALLMTTASRIAAHACVHWRSTGRADNRSQSTAGPRCPGKWALYDPYVPISQSEYRNYYQSQLYLKNRL